MSVQKKEILIVDDEVDFRLDLAEVLVEQGYSVMTAPNGVEALRQIDVEGRIPDLITVDMNMPKKDGLAFQAELTRLRPGIPMIMITGFAPARSESMNGIKAILSKPLDKHEFLNLIHTHLS